MWSIDRRRTTTVFLVAAMAWALVACTPGIQAGDVTSKFTGVKDAQVLSPTAVRLSWQKSEGYDFFDVYADYSQSPIATQVTDSALIEGLTPDTDYVFKVVGRGAAGRAGTPKQIKVRTWPRFEGVKTATADTDGNLVISWDYPYSVDEFLVYYDEEKSPTIVSTSQWANYKGRTSGQSISFKDLKGSVNYHFMVHARYRGDELERPLKVAVGTTKSSFPAPVYTIPPITIGSLPQIYLEPGTNTEFKEEFYTSRLLKDDTAASDPLIGKGWLTFSPSMNLPLGKVENITMKITYSDNKVNETLTVGPLSTYLKGVTPFLDMPPQQNLSAGQGFMGRSTAAGDFNCDGYEDLAVGLPDVSLASLGSTKVRTGAVYIYYGGHRKVYPDGSIRYVLKTEAEVPGLIPKRYPTLPGVDPQIITFDDLSEEAQFGYSLFGRLNLNGDVGGTGLPCQDLLVGAPIALNPSRNRRDGNAFVFFGSPDGLRAPTTLAAMSANASTCDGRFQGASCTAVRLFEDTNLWPADDDGPLEAAYDFYSVGDDGTRGRFGAVVTGIGDFNADGYEDIAIGSPYGRWDGKKAGSSSPNVDPGNPGFVAIYFGSKFGLGAAQVTTSSAVNPEFRFVKVYAPLPKDGMLFGASISGGVDVDGRALMTLPGGARAGGADMVIGSPGFNYMVDTNARRTIGGGTFLLDTGPAVPGYASSVAQNSAFIRPAEEGFFAFTGTARYGITLNNATGAAFLYFGRTGEVDTNNSDLENFWSCGRRGMELNSTHFSCLNNRNNWRMLFPRAPGYNGTAYGFGSAVMLLGNSQARDPATNNLYCPPVTPGALGDPTPVANCTPRRADANADGLGDVMVLAPNGNGGRGEIWQFFGNQDRVFEGGGANDRFSGNNVLAETYNTTSACTNFASVGAKDRTADKRACAPTLVRSTSVNAGALLGSNQRAVDRGDMTNDGLQDLIIGSSSDATVASGAGAIYIFTSSLGQGLISSFSKLFGASMNQNDALGASVTVGDFDVGPPGRINDVVSGAPTDSVARAAGGSVRLFLSGASTLPAIKSSIETTLTDSMGSFQQYDYGSARIVGDINGDGYEDGVAHIMSFAEDGATVYDAVVYFGSPMGLVTTTFCLANQSRVFSGAASPTECYPAKSHPAGITRSDVTLPQLITRPVGSTSRWAELAFRAGDVNGDGYGDVVLIDPAGPQMVVFYGTRGGLQDLVAPSFTPAINDAQIVTKQIALSDLRAGSGAGFYDESNRPGDILDYRHADAVKTGDLNGDGYADLVIANAGQHSRAMTTSFAKIPGADELCVDGNGDPGDCLNPAHTKSAWSCDPSDSGNTICLEGTAVRGHGAIFVFYGGPGGVQTPSTIGVGNDSNLAIGSVPTSTTAFKNLYSSESVAGNRSCSGGVCVPGYLRNPVFVNMPYGYRRLDHQFGASVSIVDVNNDGVDDLLVGSPGYEHPTCWHTAFDSPLGTRPAERVRNNGRVYVFYGSKLDGGLRAAAETDYYLPVTSWTDDLCHTDNDTEPALGVLSGRVRALQVPLGLELWDPGSADASKFVTDAREDAAGVSGHFRTRFNRSFGMRVEGVGDLNNDGFEDIAISAPYENVLDSAGNTVMGAGVVYVYYGPVCSTDNLKDVHTEIQAAARVNKTNLFLDLVGITPAVDCQGKSLAPQRFFVQDSLPGDRFGMTVVGGRAPKGTGPMVMKSDVNLDGFGDVLIGSFNTSDPVSGATNLGRGVVYFGSPTGLYTDDFPSAVIETLSGGRVKPYVIKPPVPVFNGAFFKGNLSQGDVNGDGANDYLIPSYNFNGDGVTQGVNLGTFFMFY